jgi:plastocyanin domain-containing protein
VTSPSQIIIDVKVDETGFVPSSIHVKPGDSVELHLTRTTKDTCATAIQIPSLKMKRELPLGKMVSIRLEHLAKGDIRFGCTDHMMFTGVIVVE